MKHIALLGLVGILVIGCGFTFDGDAASGSAGLLKGIGAGILMGLVAAVLGYAKDRDANKKWDFKTAGPTLLVGAIVGGFAGWQKKDLTTAVAWIESGSLVMIAEVVWKALWRNAGAPALGAILGSLKGGAGNPSSNQPQ